MGDSMTVPVLRFCKSSIHKLKSRLFPDLFSNLLKEFLIFLFFAYEKEKGKRISKRLFQDLKALKLMLLPLYTTFCVLKLSETFCLSGKKTASVDKGKEQKKH
jgi:hypothetical protein